MIAQPDVEIRTVLPFRVLVDEAMRLTRRHGRAIYPWIAGPMAVFGVAMVVAQQPMTRKMMASATNPEADPLAFFSSMLPFFAVSLMAGAVYGVASVAALAAATDAVRGGTTRMGQWWLWSVHPTRLLTMLGVGIMIVLGMILCFIPGVVLGVLAGLTVPVMVTEGIWGQEAIARSFRLVRQNPEGRFATHPGVRLFTIGVIGSILSYILSFLVQLPFAIAQQVMMLRSVGSGGDPFETLTSPWLMALQVPSALLSWLVTAAVSLYMSFAVALFFDDLVRRLEGGDLVAALETFEGRASVTPS
jgi:hypothetical protein